DGGGEGEKVRKRRRLREQVIEIAEICSVSPNAGDVASDLLDGRGQLAIAASGVMKTHKSGARRAGWTYNREALRRDLHRQCKGRPVHGAEGACINARWRLHHSECVDLR